MFEYTRKIIKDWELYVEEEGLYDRKIWKDQALKELNGIEIEKKKYKDPTTLLFSAISWKSKEKYKVCPKCNELMDCQSDCSTCKIE
jgi:hypothetical protein